MPRVLTRGTPAATPPPPNDGTPADAETIGLVTDATRELFACFNAGDLARLFALYSDEYLLATWGGTLRPDLGTAEGNSRLRELETAKPLPAEQQLSLKAVDDVRTLSDGRVVATVTNNRGSSLAVFIKSGDRYLLDWIYELPPAGTPTP